MEQGFSGKAASFNAAAETYDKMRPGYVPELYREILRYRPITAQSRVLEVGIGTGQATRPILETGCILTAVEPGDKLVRTAGEKFRAYPNFSVENTTFEALSLPEGSFDLIFAATAFHWIPPEVGYPKVLRLLKPGGAFARFANRPWPEPGPLNDAIQTLYEIYKPPARSPKPFGEAEAQEISYIGKPYGFTDIQVHLFHRTRSFSPEEYTALLGTYSDHLSLPEEVRSEFFSRIAEAIRTHGGRLNIHDTLDLELARKP